MKNISQLNSQKSSHIPQLMHTNSYKSIDNHEKKVATVKYCPLHFDYNRDDIRPRIGET